MLRVHFRFLMSTIIFSKKNRKKNSVKQSIIKSRERCFSITEGDRRGDDVITETNPGSTATVFQPKKNPLWT